MKILNQIIIVLLLTFSVSGLKAQTKKIDTAYIKTSAICEDCKERIEKAMAYENGVKSADLNVDTKMLTVVFKTNKTDIETIRKSISEVGYDADDVPANMKAYEKLPDCCRKE